MTSLTSGADLRADAGSHDPKPKLDQPTTIQGLLIFMGITRPGPFLHGLEHLSRHAGNRRSGHQLSCRSSCSASRC